MYNMVKQYKNYLFTFRALLRLVCIVNFFFSTAVVAGESVTLGVDLLKQERYGALLHGRRVGLLTNHSGVDSLLQPSYKVISDILRKRDGKLVALFTPEHGLTGASYAEKQVKDERLADGTPVYSLYGKTMRPTAEMLKGIDLLIYDIQDIGTRSYTYATSLFYLIEAAAAAKIPVMVLDRPNPINGVTIDGPMVEKKWRSIVGYIDVPYCHGMTIGELALFFNEEHEIGCKVSVVPMIGWKRSMTFSETGLTWIPTSPQIPESSTALYYPMTGLIGALSLTSIGIGYTLPFKVVGAPWLEADSFAEKLNEQRFPGVCFVPTHFTPFYGKFAKELCHGVLIVVKDPQKYRPIATQYLLIGMIKSLYPKEFAKGLPTEKHKIESFSRACGTGEVYELLKKKGSVVWPLLELDHKGLKAFIKKREKYLLY